MTSGHVALWRERSFAQPKHDGGAITHEPMDQDYYEWLVGLWTAGFSILYWAHQIVKEYRIRGVWQLYVGLAVFSLTLTFFFYWQLTGSI